MGESFALVFVNSVFNTGDITPVVSLFFLFLARILPIIAFAPFFGSRVLPHPVKVVFAISLFVIFLPQLVSITSTPIGFNIHFLLLAFKEMFVGFLLGFLISVPFIIVQNAGILIDHQRGGASLMVNDPTIQNQSSPLGTLFNFVLIFIFYYIDGPFLFIEALVSAYEVIPPDRFLNTAFFDKSTSFWKTQVSLLNQVMVISIRLASPALIMILMTDFFLGIANRLAPQVQITFLGMPLKSLLALLIVCLGWKLVATEFGKQSYYWLNEIVNILKIFKATNVAA